MKAIRITAMALLFLPAVALGIVSSIAISFYIVPVVVFRACMERART